ncbi:DUF368 domain-containing protein [Thermoproteota archaeon]
MCKIKDIVSRVIQRFLNSINKSAISVYTVFCGIIIGIANVIPGVSGGTMAVILGVYDTLMESIACVFSRPEKRKTYVLFLLQIGVGALVGIALFAKLMMVLLTSYPKPTMYVFILLIIGGIPRVFKQHHNMKIDFAKLLMLGAGFFGLIALTALPHLSQDGLFLGSGSAVFLLVLSGFVAAGAMVIPGISGSMMLLILGTYTLILGAVNGIIDALFLFVKGDFNTLFSEPVLNQLILDKFTLFLFVIGVAAGIFSIAKLMNICIERWPGYTYYMIIGLMLASIFKLWPGF